MTMGSAKSESIDRKDYLLPSSAFSKLVLK